MKLAKTIIILLSALGCGQFALAQEGQRVVKTTRNAQAVDSLYSDWEDDPFDLEQIVVTGTRTPKALKDMPVITKVISTEDIKKVDATNVLDLLQQEVPGLEFTYSMGSIVMNMGGFDGNNILFLVDGERMAGETMDNVDYNRLNLSSVDHIEIVKGASSTLYGSQAMGGVINIITKTNIDPWTLNLNSKYDSQMGWRNGGVVTFNAGRFNSTTDVQYTSQEEVTLSDNPESSLSTIFGGEAFNVKEKLIYKASDGLKLTGRASYMQRDRHSGATSKEMYRDAAMGLKADWKIGDHSDLEVAYSFDQYDKSDYLRLTHLDVRDYSNRQNIVRLLSNTSLASLKSVLTVGGDYMYDYLQTYQFEDDGHRDQQSADAFVQLDYSPTTSFSLIAGGRYDYFSESDRGHFTGKLSAMYRWKRLTVRGGYASAFRAPSLKELYMNFFMGSIFYIYGNEELQPETNHNLNLSLEQSGSLWNNVGKYCLTVNGNYNWFKNYITTTYTSDRSAMKYTNIADIQIFNVDASAQVMLNNGVGARLNYAYVKETVKRNQVDLTAARPHSFTWRIFYDHQFHKNYGLNVALSGRYLSAFDTDQISSTSDLSETTHVHYEGYQIWKLQLSQRIWRGLQVNFAIDNLFNYTPDLYEFNSPTSVGSTYSVGVSLDIERWFK